MRVFLCGLVLCGISHPSFCEASLASYLQLPQLFPERDLSLVEGDRPDWRKEWDSGRRLVRAGEYREAAESYRRLLAARGNIEEARWELSLILARLEEWDKARVELELLVEGSPDDVDYLNVLGLALRHVGQSGRAMEIFSKVRERSPDNFTALVGVAQGLVEAGRKREAVPLIQAVVAGKPEDRELSLTLVSLTYELGQLETARRYLVPLAASRKTELETLLLAARVHDGLARENEGAAYWERVLLLEPSNREARERLARYYESSGLPDKALVHLRVLLEMEPKNISILTRICRIYLTLDKVGEAMPYVEAYLQLCPDDLDFIRTVLNSKSASGDDRLAFFRCLVAVTPDDLRVFNALAAEQVAAGNPAGALSLWEQVARAAPARVEVFRTMVPLLEELGREDRLLAVLAIIHQLAPGDLAVIGRLARMKVARGELTQGLEEYNLLEQSGYNGIDLYIDRAALYEELGQPSQALADYAAIFAVAPERDEIRRRCISLAGALGEVNLLIRVAEGVEQRVSGDERSRELLLLAQAFAQARDDGRAARYYLLILAEPDADRELSRSESFDEFPVDFRRFARLGLAEVYRRDGRVFEAEQVLRGGLLSDGAQGEYLSQLFELALHGSPPDLESGRTWLEQYERQSRVNPDLFVIMQARLLAASGDYPRAERLLRHLLYEKSLGSDSTGKEDRQTFRLAGLRLAEVLLASGELVASEQQCLSMLRDEPDREVSALLVKIQASAGEGIAAEKLLQQLQKPGEDGARLLDLAELLGQQGQPAGQFAVADKVLARWPGSLRAGFQKVEALWLQGKINEALAAGAALGEIYPGISSVALLNARLHYQAGEYSQAITLCARLEETEPDRLDVQYLRVCCEMMLGDPAEAARLVRDLYPLEGGLYLKKAFTDSALELPQPRRKRSLWQVLTFSREPFDVVREVVNAHSFLDQNPERRKINELVTGVLARLLWEKNFRAALVLRE